MIRSVKLSIAIVLASAHISYGIRPAFAGDSRQGQQALLLPGGKSEAGPIAIHAYLGSPVLPAHSAADMYQLKPSWFPCVGGCTGDLNLDGVVDSADLGLLIGAWGTDGSIVDGSDLDGDGEVGASDLGLLIARWGVCN